ncbi:uncharacterized protein LOC114356665 [Ostrinia furnacalis]|uniref:uncharacterized protein LOC114356665 n=1 Tax=Ostrinia furnacalis TaxID=93504 RepID=UPI00103A7A23|nr:uncharacterized protein LOC114356665 [Ostrinia furnacalis]
MAEKVETKSEALPDLDDLLQCPVCYEIPTGQIFQCNEGHHVCGRCKMRLDMCPVCRALFFGTRNYAMEELIANVRKLRAFKLGGKVTTGTDAAESSTPASTETTEPGIVNEEEEEPTPESSNQVVIRAPQACKGLFRCLCCKTGNGERLPAARLLNHLRYYHSPELIEGQSENGEYVQAWQFSTVPGRIVTAVRISDMGVFFLIIEINSDSVCAWLAMAASPWIAHEFCYTVTISGNDREAIFSDCVWSVRSCEGSLKKRGRCLMVNGLDARALVAPVAICGKLAVRRTPHEQLAQLPQPRAVLRVASRGNARDGTRLQARDELEPFLQDLQNDVARLSRAFATLGREADALVRSEAEMRARIENGARPNVEREPEPAPVEPPPVAPVEPDDGGAPREMSRNARRRLRQRLRAAMNEPPRAAPVPPEAQLPNGRPTVVSMRQAPVPPPPAPPVPPPASGPSNGHAAGAQGRTNKKKRRQRR